MPIFKTALLSPTLMRLSLIGIFLSLFSIGASAPATPFHEWGIGVIHFPAAREFFEIDSLLNGLESVLVYAKPNGDVCGKLVSEGILLNGKSTPLSLDPKDAKGVGYEVDGLIYLAEEAGFVKIAYHTTLAYTETGGIWVKREALEQRGFQAQSWMGFLLESEITLFPNALGIRMNLRAEPHAKGKWLTTLEDDRYFIHPTGNASGIWAEVKVSLMREEFCSGDETIVQEWTGWVKLLDDLMYPNLWFYSGGC